VKYPIFFGIDLTSTEAKPSACLGLDDKSQLVYVGFLTENRDIVALLNFYSPQVIAIDAPLSLPLGLCCLEESCPCKPKFPRKNRQCDQELRQQGIPCYPTSKKTFIKDLIYRGIELKTSIDREAKQAGQVIEIYPFASKVRLFGKTIPRKTTKQGMNFVRGKLGEILPSLEPYSGMFDHNLYDAAVAAYTALLYHQNRVEALGNSREGIIFIPS
jgi:predicted nuclease with RNAse H fold